MELTQKAKNEETKLAEAKLEDLPVIGEQTEETKGAGASNGRLTQVPVFVCPSD